MHKTCSALRKDKPRRIYVSSDGPKTSGRMGLAALCREERETMYWDRKKEKLSRSEISKKDLFVDD